MKSQLSSPVAVCDNGHFLTYILIASTYEVATVAEW